MKCKEAESKEKKDVKSEVKPYAVNFKKSKIKCKKAGSKNKCVKPYVNGFILFFLKMLRANPKASENKVAKVAGKCWREMDKNQRCKYIIKARKHYILFKIYN